MGAAARQRGDRLIQQQLAENEIVSIRRSYLCRLESDLLRLEKLSKELGDSADAQKEQLRHADAFIARLRAENQVLKAEKSRLFGVVDAMKRHVSIAGNPQKKWAVSFVKSQLEKARLI